MDTAQLDEYCKTLGLALSPDQLTTMADFEAALYERNQVTNLTRVPREQSLVRHFVDSLLVSEFVPVGSSVLDIGTGPGFPAWPLACARPDLSVTAMDSAGKMLDFLREHPLPNLEVRQGRAEVVTAPDSYDFVTGRAVAPLSIQLEVSSGWCRVGGLVVPFRTPADALPRTDVLGLLGLSLRSSEARSLPEGLGERVFPIYEKIRPADPRYPRRWADMKKRPLT